MKPLGVGITIFATILSAVLIGGCTNRTSTTAAQSTGAASSSTTSSEGSQSPRASKGSVVHQLTVGETVDIHGAKVTVTSAKDSPNDLAGMRTFVVHVKFENGSSNAPTMPFDHLDWVLEYSNGARSGKAIDQTGLERATYARGEGAEGDIYFPKEWATVSKVIYTPEMFDWYPEVTAWDVK